MRTRLPAAAVLVMLAARSAADGGAATAPPDASGLPAEIGEAALVQLVEQRSLDLQADQAAVALAEADVLTARALPNPQVSYSHLGHAAGDPGVNGSGQDAWAVTQPFELAGKRAARRAVAAAGVAAARAGVSVETVDLVLAARRAFVHLLADQERERLGETALADVTHVQGVVNGRAEAGVRSRYDVERMTLESAQVAADLAAARTALADDRAALAALAAAPGWQPVARGDLQAPPVPLDDGSGVAALPPVVEARAEAAVADAEVTEARRARWPDLDLTAGIQQSTSPFSSYVSLGPAITLPLFDHGRGPLAHANAEARQGDLRARAVEAAAGAEAARARTALADRTADLATFEAAAFATLPELRRMAEDAYLTGAGDVLDMLDTLRHVHETEATHVDLQEAALLARLDVLRATGRLEAAMRPPPAAGP